MTERTMKVKFGEKMSTSRTLIGGSGQGTLLGGLQYIVSCNDVAGDVDSADKLHYFDDLEILELIMLADILGEYNFHEHIASDIGTNQKYLSPKHLKMQPHLDNIQSWTESNKMKLNYEKSNFIIFTRAQTDFTTRLTLGNNNLEQVSAIKLLGVWITEDLSWDLNCKEMIKKAYARVSLLTKLKYVGLKTEDLIDVYVLFIRSCVEYCSVVYHSSLTQQQSEMLERVQKVCLRVLLNEMYVDYESALEMCSLTTLFSRRVIRSKNFCLKAIKHKKHKNMFPLSKTYTENIHNVRNPEKFTVNFASGETYKKSSIPYLQRTLNSIFVKKPGLP